MVKSKRNCQVMSRGREQNSTQRWDRATLLSVEILAVHEGEEPEVVGVWVCVFVCISLCSLEDIEEVVSCERWQE